MQIKWLSLAVGVVMLLGSTYFGYALIDSQVAQSKAASDFRATRGKVLSARVVTYGAAPARMSVNNYRPEIRYRYQVDGRNYESDRYGYLHAGFKDYEAARKVVDRYRVGRLVKVYYDPDDPADAVLYRAPPPLSVWVIGIPFGFLVLTGLLSILHGLGIGRGRRQSEPG